MKVKIFSHKSDPDGLGSVILSTFTYGGGRVDITLVKGNEELNEQFTKFLKENRQNDFDIIYITDLCLSIELLDRIQESTELREKILIFDHHQSSMDKLEKEYPFLTELEMKGKEKCCGTSLFYEYLLETSDNTRIESDYIKTFVELTRLHDTYEWKEKNNMDAYYLQILYQFLGPWGYYYHFVKRMKEENIFSYQSEEREWIEIQIKCNQEKIVDMYQKMITREHNGIKYGVSFANYEYRNLLADYIKEHNQDLDVMLLIAGDEDRFSFGSLKESIDVNKMAETCGGGGHKKAAGGELNSDTITRILKFIK